MPKTLSPFFNISPTWTLLIDIEAPPINSIDVSFTKPLFKCLCISSRVGSLGKYFLAFLLIISQSWLFTSSQSENRMLSILIVPVVIFKQYKWDSQLGIRMLSGWSFTEIYLLFTKILWYPETTIPWWEKRNSWSLASFKTAVTLPPSCIMSPILISFMNFFPFLREILVSPAKHVVVGTLSSVNLYILLVQYAIIAAIVPRKMKIAVMTIAIGQSQGKIHMITIIATIIMITIISSSTKAPSMALDVS